MIGKNNEDTGDYRAQGHKTLNTMEATTDLCHLTVAVGT